MDLTKNNPILLGDTLLLKVNESKQISNIIITPEKRDFSTDLVEGTVMNIGKRFRHKHDVKIGSIVMVPRHFGTVLDNAQPDIKVFDGEDVQAIVT